MINNKSPRLAEMECGAVDLSSASGRTEPTKKPAVVFHPGLMRSFGECSFLEDSRYASQAFCGKQPWFSCPGRSAARVQRVVRCRHRSRVYPRSALKCAQVG